MTEEYTFPPFKEEMEKLIEGFGGTMMENYQGHDIRPFWDLKKGAITSSFAYLYKAPKLEKIFFSIQRFRDKLDCYTLSIWPDDRHALPIYSAFWAESVKASYFLVDFYPTSDCVLDLPYLEKYLDPLEDIFDRNYTEFPVKSQREFSWFKTFSSPFLVTADIIKGTEETQGNILRFITDYLKVYLDLYEADETESDEYMAPIVKRKKAIRKILFERDPGGFMVEKALGKELAHIYLNMTF